MRTLTLIPMLVCVVGCASCREPPPTKVLPPGQRIDKFNQQSASKIDVLWVVDNSGSMEPRQNQLAENFAAFMTEFTRNAVDYRIGITSTDIFRDAGDFLGSPTVLRNNTPSVIDAFKNNIRVGINGSPYEAGLEAARLALEQHKLVNNSRLTNCRNECNSLEPVARPACQSTCDVSIDYDFLRPGAYLYIIFVTDEEDRSQGDIRYFYRYFETVKGVGNDGMVQTAAIMGDVPSNTCGATPGSRYKQLIELTGGELGSICDENFAVTLQKLAQNAVGLRRKFALQELPDAHTIEPYFLFPCNVEAWKLASCERVDRTTCEAAEAEQRYVECTPRQGEPDGWVYEEANNVIYFSGNSVPALGAEVNIRYFEEGMAPVQ